MKKLPKAYRPLFSASLIALFTATSALATPLLNDSFSNGELGPQDLPNSAQWYGSESSNLNATTGSMTLDTNGGTTSGMVTGYFTNSNSYTIATNETLTLSFDFTVSGVDGTSGFFRLALLNSGSDANRINAQGQGSNNSKFTNYTGYAAFTNLASFDNSIGLYKRDNSKTGLLNATDAYSSLGDSGSSFQLQNGVNYTSTLSLKNTGDSIIITQSFSGGDLENISYTLTDTSDLYTEFNTIAIALQSKAATSITFSNISITTAIPEPGTTAFGLGMLVLISVAFWRHKRQ